MVYCTSDLHGISLEKFQYLLKKANFSEDDELYILGDVIDRGEDGIKLLTFIMNSVNMNFILGNHEAMLLLCDFIFDEITEESINSFDTEKTARLMNWLENGAEPTLNALKNLKKQNHELLIDLLDFLRDTPIYDVVTADNKEFLLVHGGFRDFSPDKKMSDYTESDILWARPEITDEYFNDFITILGHTPTVFYGSDYNGKILKTKSWINIDTTLKIGNKMISNPCLLRLDDMKEFYL